jgi:hypothetical protein
MARCVLLAMLLHLWLVLMLGNAPGGTAMPGQGVFGAINITLRGPVGDRAGDSGPAATPAPGTAPESDSPRWGGRVRQTELPPDSVPGAERLGVPGPQAPEALPAPPPQAVPVPPPRELPSTVPRELPAAQPSTPLLTAPDRVSVPPLAPMPPLPGAVLLTPAVAPTAPAPAPAPEPAPPPVPAERSLSTPLLPAVRGGAPALAREPAAAALPDLQALPTPTAAPAALRQLPAAPATTAPRPAETALPRAAPADAVTLPSMPTVPTIPALGTLVQTLGQAGPDAGSRVGHDVATPAAAAASQPPRLNLDLARPRGGELSRFSTSGALPLLPRPPELDEKLARDIEKSGKADCRKAYAGAGVLAVVPLLTDAVKGSGCKW